MSQQPAWEPAPDGVILPVLAQPGARQNGVKGVRDGRLIVAVSQAPEKGKANSAIIELLADALGVKRRQIALRSGETSSRKRFLISGVERAVLEARVAPLLPSSAADAGGSEGPTTGESRRPSPA